MRAQQELVELRESDLQYQAHEVAMFLRDTLNLELSDETIGTLAGTPDQQCEVRLFAAAAGQVTPPYFGSLAAAEQELQAAESLTKPTRILRNLCLVLDALAHTALRHAQLSRAERIAHEQLLALQHDTAATSDLVQLCSADSIRAIVYYQRHEPELAAGLLERAVQPGGPMAQSEPAVLARVYLALVQHALGDTERSDDLLAEAAALATRLSERAHDTVALYRLWLWLIRGESVTATAWVRSRSVLTTARTNYSTEIDREALYLRDLGQFLLAWLYLKQQQPTRTMAITRLLRHTATRHGHADIAINALVLEALARHTVGDSEQARAVLTQALNLTRPEGYRQVFLQHGSAMAALLESQREQLVPDAFVRGLFAALGLDLPEGELPGTPAQTAESATVPSILSQRELQLLQLVDAGLSNSEIAEQLVLAESTVKTYLKNMYRKLHVSSRTKALVRARELRLL